MSEKYEQILMEEFEKLSPKAQEGFLTLVINIEVAKELCKGPKMTEEKIEKFSQIALGKEDYVTFWLLQFKRAIDRLGKN